MPKKISFDLKSVYLCRRFSRTIGWSEDFMTETRLEMLCKMKPLYLTSLLLAFFQLAAHAQENKYGATEEQQRDCKEALNVYKGYLKQGDLPEAYIQWQKACAVCPEGVSESLYADGVKLLKSQIEIAEKANSTARTAVLRDSLFATYDKRMELFPSTNSKPKNRCIILSFKAQDYAKFYKDDPIGANAMYKECVECLQDETNAATLSAYYLTSFYTMKKLEGDAAKNKLLEMLTDYLTLVEYANSAILRLEAQEPSEERDKDIQSYQKVKGNLDEVFVSIAKCDDMVPVLSGKLAATPNDPVLERKILTLLNKKDCTDSPLYLQVAQSVHRLEPQAASAYAIGTILLKNRDFNAALPYLEQAIELCGNCAEKENYLLKTGQVNSFLDRFAAAKNYARSVLSLNPNNADAYILLGDAIAGNAGACNDGALGTRAAYWIAADYYSRARSIGSPEQAEIASKKQANCERQFPTLDDVFAVGKQKGDGFTQGSIPGCLCAGESTTIRVR
jgi:tetratricopeptide (TPR) repeat protein